MLGCLGAVRAGPCQRLCPTCPRCSLDRVEVGEAFEQWSRAVEASVDAALRQQHAQDPVKYPVPYLPKTYRGRCHPRRVLQRPLAHTLRLQRNGDYVPKEEATSVRSRQRTCQVRRAQTLLHGLRKATRPAPSMTRLCFNSCPTSGAPYCGPQVPGSLFHMATPVRPVVSRPCRVA